MPRSSQNPMTSPVASRMLDSNTRNNSPWGFGARQTSSRIAALSIEFVAKPSEAHKVQTALPMALQGALGEVDGFGGSFVLVANHEARLVTVVTLWCGEDRMKRCNENVRWVRALLAPYLDRCLRVQSLAAYVPEAPQTSEQFEQACSETMCEQEAKEEEVMCVA